MSAGQREAQCVTATLPWRDGQAAGQELVSYFNRE